MISSSGPPKFPIPWGNSAGVANIRSIPTASQIPVQAGAASLTDGFPPLNFVPVAAGGIPPFGQDMNGILNQVTRWSQWGAAGGPIFYDSTFAAAVGGYPRGAQLMANNLSCVLESIVENNLQDPNSAAPSQWRVAWSVYSGAAWSAAGSANVQTVLLQPSPPNLAALVGIPIWILSSGTNTGSVTLNPNSLGAVQVVTTGGIQLAPGSLVSSYPYQVIYNGSVFIRTSFSSAYQDPATQGLAIYASSGGQGANLRLVGPGSTTPTKTLRALNGHLQVVNDAYNGIPLDLSDAGILTTTGDVVSQGHIHAAAGAVGTGDSTIATLLGDFFGQSSINPGGNGMDYLYQQLPNGWTIQGFGGVNTTGADTITFPTAFASKCYQVIAAEGNPNGWNSGVGPTIFGTQNPNNANFALFVTKWTAPAWALAGSIAYRYIAIGK